MQAAVVEAPGESETLRIRDLPVPAVCLGWALVCLQAAGVNRSELMTRRGESGAAVRFPRVLGIEGVGTVAAVAADSCLQPGQTVAAVMGGMGREFDGSYAEYALLPERQLIPLHTELDWPTLAAIPETWLTAHGSLEALDLHAGQTVLVTAATSSVGMAAIALATQRGITVIATTRNASKEHRLHTAGAAHVLVMQDMSQLPQRVRALLAHGPDAALDLVGGQILLDCLHTVRPGGIVCSTGILDSWNYTDFQPLVAIPTGTKLTVYESGVLTAAASTNVLQHIVDDVAAGALDAHLDRVFTLDQIAQAHDYMEANRATGKVVISTSP